MPHYLPTDIDLSDPSYDSGTYSPLMNNSTEWRPETDSSLRLQTSYLKHQQWIQKHRGLCQILDWAPENRPSAGQMEQIEWDGASRDYHVLEIYQIALKINERVKRPCLNSD